jgi:rubrerythrin
MPWETGVIGYQRELRAIEGLVNLRGILGIKGGYMMNAIKLGIKTETDAIVFYRQAAGKTSHPFGKKMFLSIAEDEQQHLDDLKCIMEGLDLKVREVLSPLKHIETAFEAHKNDLVSGIGATTDEIEVLSIAMGMEKESADLYRGLLNDVQSPKEKALFEHLIRAEEQHFRIFSNTYSFLTDTGNWFMWEEHSMVDGGTPWA